MNRFVIVNNSTGVELTVNGKNVWNRRSDASLTLNNWWKRMVRESKEVSKDELLEFLSGNRTVKVGTGFFFGDVFYFRDSLQSFFFVNKYFAKYAVSTPFQVKELKPMEIF